MAGELMSVISQSRIKQLVRQTICFSESEVMHELVIRLFINRYEFGLPI